MQKQIRARNHKIIGSIPSYFVNFLRVFLQCRVFLFFINYNTRALCWKLSGWKKGFTTAVFSLLKFRHPMQKHMRSARDLSARNTNSGRQKAYEIHTPMPRTAATPGMCMHPFVKVSLLSLVFTSDASTSASISASTRARISLWKRAPRNHKHKHKHKHKRKHQNFSFSMCLRSLLVLALCWFSLDTNVLCLHLCLRLCLRREWKPGFNQNTYPSLSTLRINRWQLSLLGWLDEQFDEKQQ